MGIAMMYFGKGLAKFLGKPLIHPAAPKLQDIDVRFNLVQHHR